MLRNSTSLFRQSRHTLSGMQTILARYASCGVFFTPKDDCRSKIVEHIREAKTSINIQAYFFTCKSIAREIAYASKRGVDVVVILDRGQYDYKYSAYKQLLEDGIDVLFDNPAGLAHSKVMIIDDHVVITGSFNLTYAAQARNHETLEIRDDTELAKLYQDNFNERLSVAKRMT